MNVPVTRTRAQLANGVSAPGKYVEMRAEMDVVCLISNCPQLNNPCNAYNLLRAAADLGNPDDPHAPFEARRDVRQNPDSQSRCDRLPHRAHAEA